MKNNFVEDKNFYTSIYTRTNIYIILRTNIGIRAVLFINII